MLDADCRRVAIELELSVKSAERLRRILAGFLLATWFDEVCLLVCEPHVGRALQRAALHAQAYTPAALFGNSAQPKLIVAPWPLLDVPARQTLAQTFERGEASLPVRGASQGGGEPEADGA